MGQINGTAAPIVVGDWPKLVEADFAEYEWGFMEQIVNKRDAPPHCFLTVEIDG